MVEAPRVKLSNASSSGRNGSGSAGLPPNGALPQRDTRDGIPDVHKRAADQQGPRSAPGAALVARKENTVKSPVGNISRKRDPGTRGAISLDDNVASNSARETGYFRGACPGDGTAGADGNNHANHGCGSEKHGGTECRADDKMREFPSGSNVAGAEIGSHPPGAFTRDGSISRDGFICRTRGACGCCTENGDNKATCDGAMGENERTLIERAVRLSHGSDASRTQAYRTGADSARGNANYERTRSRTESPAVGRKFSSRPSSAEVARLARSRSLSAEGSSCPSPSQSLSSLRGASSPTAPAPTPSPSPSLTFVGSASFSHSSASTSVPPSPALKRRFQSVKERAQAFLQRAGRQRTSSPATSLDAAGVGPGGRLAAPPRGAERALSASPAARADDEAQRICNKVVAQPNQSIGGPVSRESIASSTAPPAGAAASAAGNVEQCNCAAHLSGSQHFTTTTLAYNHTASNHDHHLHHNHNAGRVTLDPCNSNSQPLINPDTSTGAILVKSNSGLYSVVDITDKCRSVSEQELYRRKSRENSLSNIDKLSDSVCYSNKLHVHSKEKLQANAHAVATRICDECQSDHGLSHVERYENAEVLRRDGPGCSESHPCVTGAPKPKGDAAKRANSMASPMEVIYDEPCDGDDAVDGVAASCECCQESCALEEHTCEYANCGGGARLNKPQGGKVPHPTGASLGNPGWGRRMGGAGSTGRRRLGSGDSENSSDRGLRSSSGSERHSAGDAPLSDVDLTSAGRQSRKAVHPHPYHGRDFTRQASAPAGRPSFSSPSCGIRMAEMRAASKRLVPHHYYYTLDPDYILNLSDGGSDGSSNKTSPVYCEITGYERTLSLPAGAASHESLGGASGQSSVPSDRPPLPPRDYRLSDEYKHGQPGSFKSSSPGVTQQRSSSTGSTPSQGTSRPQQGPSSPGVSKIPGPSSHKRHSSPGSSQKQQSPGQKQRHHSTGSTEQKSPVRNPSPNRHSSPSPVRPHPNLGLVGVRLTPHDSGSVQHQVARYTALVEGAAADARKPLSCEVPGIHGAAAAAVSNILNHSPHPHSPGSSHRSMETSPSRSRHSSGPSSISSSTADSGMRAEGGSVCSRSQTDPTSPRRHVISTMPQSESNPERIHYTSPPSTLKCDAASQTDKSTLQRQARRQRSSSGRSVGGAASLRSPSSSMSSSSVRRTLENAQRLLSPSPNRGRERDIERTPLVCRLPKRHNHVNGQSCCGGGSPMRGVVPPGSPIRAAQVTSTGSPLGSPTRRSNYPSVQIPSSPVRAAMNHSTGKSGIPTATGALSPHRMPSTGIPGPMQGAGSRSLGEPSKDSQGRRSPPGRGPSRHGMKASERHLYR